MSNVHRPVEFISTKLRLQVFYICFVDSPLCISMSKGQRQNQNVVKIRGIYRYQIRGIHIYKWLISIISSPSIIFASRGDNLVLESKQTSIDDFFFKNHQTRLHQKNEICKFQSNYSIPHNYMSPSAESSPWLPPSFQLPLNMRTFFILL